MRKPCNDWTAESWIGVFASIVIGVFLLAIIGALAVIALGGITVQTDTTVKPTQTMTVQLPDSRRVTCITVKNGLSCDWPHASGADKDDTQ